MAERKAKAKTKRTTKKAGAKAATKKAKAASKRKPPTRKVEVAAPEEEPPVESPPPDAPETGSSPPPPPAPSPGGTTNDEGDSVGAAERKQLRAELDANKRFVLERPFVVLTATLALAGALGRGIPSLAPALVLMLMYFSLWFTWNRSNSSARIVAYLRLVHETKELRSPGWEEALARYRAREHPATCADAGPDRESLAFYKGLYWFHVVGGGLTALALTLGIHERLPSGRVGTLPSFLLVADWIALIAFVALCYRHRPGAGAHGLTYYLTEWRRTLA